MLSSQAGRPHCADIEHVKTDTRANSAVFPQGSGLVGSSQENGTGSRMLLMCCARLTATASIQRNSGECLVFDSCTPKDAGLPISRI